MSWKDLSPEDRAFARQFINTHKWRWARTYASFCPHEYAINYEMDRPDYRRGAFKRFGDLIVKHGFNAKFGKNPGKYLIDDDTGFYYFVPESDIQADGGVAVDIHLINRSHINEFEFVEEEVPELFGDVDDGILRVRRLPPSKRKPWRELEN